MQMHEDQIKAARTLWRELMVDLVPYKALKEAGEDLTGLSDPDPTGCYHRLTTALEEVLNLQLWCVKDYKTGEMHAAPSILEADRVAWRLDIQQRNLLTVHFRVERWPHSAESHTRGLSKWANFSARTVDDVTDVEI